MNDTAGIGELSEARLSELSKRLMLTNPLSDIDSFDLGVALEELRDRRQRHAMPSDLKLAGLDPTRGDIYDRLLDWRRENELSEADDELFDTIAAVLSIEALPAPTELSREVGRLTKELGIAQILVVSRGERVLDLGNRMMDAIQRAEAAESQLSREAQSREPAGDEALHYAQMLAGVLHSKHYSDVPQWRPLPDVVGLLTQIDNMVAPLVKPEAQSRDEVVERALRPAADPKAEELDDAKNAGMDEGVNFVFDRLAKILGLTQWVGKDGSEEWAGDVLATLYGILYDGKVLDPDTNARPATPTPDAERAGEPLYIVYTNWRGETAERTVMPLRLWYGSTEWHHEPGWLLKAIDVEKGVERDFAWSGIDFQGNGTAASPDVSKAAAYYPAIIHFDEGGFDEFVTEDVATITGDMRAASIEPIFRMAEPRDLIGYRIYAAQPADTEGATKP